MQLTKNLGYLGLLGAILVGMGEFYLHYSPNVLSAPGAFNFFGYVVEIALWKREFFWLHFVKK